MSSTPATTAAAHSKRPASTHFAVASVVLGIALATAGTLADDTETDTLRRIVVTAAIVAVVAGIVFGKAVPHARRATALVLAVLGLVSLAAFWLGITPVLAAGALAAYRSGRVAARSGRISAVLAIVALPAYVVLAVIDLVTA